MLDFCNILKFDRGIVYENKNYLINEVNKITNYGIVKPILYVKNPNECEEDNYSEIINFANQYGYLIATHASETLESVGEIDKQYGLSPIGLLENYGFLDRKNIF